MSGGKKRAARPVLLDRRAKPPFGFRQDAEDKPEPDGEQREVSCTSLQQSMAPQPRPWQPPPGDWWW